MGNGATVRDASVPLAGRGSMNGHANGNGRARGEVNGHDPVHDAEGDGEVAVAAARRLTRGRVLVLNASYEPLNVCTVRRALVLLLKEKAEVLSGAITCSAPRPCGSIAPR
jgi:hypothetical protein